MLKVSKYTSVIYNNDNIILHLYQLVTNSLCKKIKVKYHHRLKKKQKINHIIKLSYRERVTLLLNLTSNNVMRLSKLAISTCKTYCNLCSTLK